MPPLLSLCLEDKAGLAINTKQQKISKTKIRNFVTNFGGPASNTDLAQPLILNPNLIRSHAAAVLCNVLRCITLNATMCIFVHQGIL